MDILHLGLFSFSLFVSMTCLFTGFLVVLFAVDGLVLTEDVLVIPIVSLLLSTEFLLITFFSGYKIYFFTDSGMIPSIKLGYSDEKHSIPLFNI